MKKTILEMPNVKWYIRQQEIKKKKLRKEITENVWKNGKETFRKMFGKTVIEHS